MTESNPLIFYDISSPHVPRSYAPNPSKARLALSFKRAPFTTTWIDILAIPSVRQSLACPATRKLDDGSDFYTLPILHDPATGKILGDSFDIANYLDDAFPDPQRTLFPPDTDTRGTGLDYTSPHIDTPLFAPLTHAQGDRNKAYARFNRHVDATFSAHLAGHGQFLPLNPETAEEVKALFARRAHLSCWDDLIVDDPVARGELLGKFREGMAELAGLFAVNEDGPYLEGERVTYADMVVGGWVNMMAMLMPREEWVEFRGWYGGVFGRLHDALQEKYWLCK